MAGLACSVHSATAQQVQGPDDALVSYVNQFLTIDRVQFSAAVVLRVHVETCDGCASDGDPIDGTYAAAYRDNRYRIDMLLDDTRFPDVDTVVAFNGALFQLHRRDESTLALSTTDQASFGAAIPDPLVESLQFLYPLIDAAPLTQLKLASIRQDEEIAERLFAVTWVSVDNDGAVAVFPGGTLDGVSYVHRVRFRYVGSLLAPEIIERVEGERVLSKYSVNTYTTQTVGQTMTVWPQTVSYRSYDEEGQVLAEFAFTIGSLTLDGTVSEDLFTLDVAPAIVWNADEQQIEY